MTIPTPPVSIANSCSTLFNGTLYTYSGDAFQSLTLSAGTQWNSLPMGIAVSGGVCVQATPQNASTPAALYIVGGTANSSQSDYLGLQRYLFADKKWETITLKTTDLKGRLYHSAAYLNASSSILMYAGTQDGKEHSSSQTFTISTLEPYNILSYTSIAPPAVSPLLIPWTENEAVMLGGGNGNKKVMVFSPSTNWFDSNTSLSQAPKDYDSFKAIVINGDDGSKNLYTFDMSISPNQVNRTVLVDGNGKWVAPADPLTARSPSTEISNDNWTQLVQKDQLTIADWPAYNASFAPTGTRNGFSIAQDTSGLVAISGGEGNTILSLFQARQNSWVDANAMLSKATDTTTTSTTSSSSNIPTPSETTASSGSKSSGGGVNTTILGATLGSILGLIIILLLALLFFRCRRNKKGRLEAGRQRRASRIPGDEKDPIDFDGGISLDTHKDRTRGHGHQGSHSSFSSVAILMGKVGQGQSKGKLGRRNGSDASSTFNKTYKTAISNPIPQDRSMASESFNTGEKEIEFAATQTPATATPRARVSSSGRRGSMRRSSGWNRYWSGGSALNILGFGAKRTTFGSASDRSSISHYSEAGHPARHLQAPVLIPPPLNFERPTGRMNRVASGSPRIANTSSGFPIKESMAGQIERPHSSISASSYGDDHRDTFSNGAPASFHEHQAWTPVSGQTWGTEGRTPSTVYSESEYAATTTRNTMVGAQPNTSMGRFPTATDNRPPQPSSDMSWLNLGGQSRV